MDKGVSFTSSIPSLALFSHRILIIKKTIVSKSQEKNMHYRSNHKTGEVSYALLNIAFVWVTMNQSDVPSSLSSLSQRYA